MCHELPPPPPPPYSSTRVHLHTVHFVSVGNCRSLSFIHRRHASINYTHTHTDTRTRRNFRLAYRFRRHIHSHRNTTPHTHNFIQSKYSVDPSTTMTTTNQLRYASLWHAYMQLRRQDAKRIINR